MASLVSVDPKPLLKQLDRLTRDHVPFAMSKALTMTAKDGQETLKKMLPTKFTIRNNWTAKGIRITPARKADGLRNMASEVGSKDWFMADQMGKDQNTRHPKAKFLFVPKRARPSKTANIPKRNKPRQLFDRVSTIVSKSKFGGGILVYSRTNLGLRLMYAGQKQQVVKPRLDMADEINTIAKQRLEPNFKRAMDYALKTAR